MLDNIPVNIASTVFDGLSVTVSAKPRRHLPGLDLLCAQPVQMLYLPAGDGQARGG